MNAETLAKVAAGNLATRKNHFHSSEKFLNAALAKLKLDAMRKGVNITTLTEGYPKIDQGYVNAQVKVGGLQYENLEIIVGVRATGRDAAGLETYEVRTFALFMTVRTVDELIRTIFESLIRHDELRTKVFVEGGDLVELAIERAMEDMTS